MLPSVQKNKPGLLFFFFNFGIAAISATFEALLLCDFVAALFVLLVDSNAPAIFLRIFQEKRCALEPSNYSMLPMN